MYNQNEVNTNEHEKIILNLKGITKKYGAVVALKQADLTLKKGEIMALLGSNGSGKSTLVKVLSGLVSADEGEIYLNSKKVTFANCRDSRKFKIAVAYQDLSLIQELNVTENITLGIEAKKKDKSIDNSKCISIAEKYMDLLKIKVDKDKKIKDLLPSTMSLIEIAKAIALEPDILVLDESTASLHSDEVDRLFEVLKVLKEKGTSVIMVTHRMNEIFRICDRCTILKSGETVASGYISDMSIDDIVFHMTGNRPDVTEKEEIRDFDKSDKKLLLDVNNLASYGLNNVNLKAYEGEIVGIGGLDGQGQKEFLHILLGDVKYRGGEVVYLDKKVNYKNTSEAIHDSIGFISGDRAAESVFPIRSVSENIYAGKSARSGLYKYLNPKNMNKFSDNVMKEYSIVAGGLDLPANSLSGGNQQKLVVGRWVSLSPNLLLLDDPTKGVDIHSRIEIHNILLNAVKEGMTVIYVSSDNEELLEICDRIYVFYEGTISECLEGELRTEERLVSAMLGLNGSMSDDKNNEVINNEY